MYLSIHVIFDQSSPWVLEHWSTCDRHLRFLGTLPEYFQSMQLSTPTPLFYLREILYFLLHYCHFTATFQISISQTKHMISM